ncbi:MAG TPA: preprotein translocase subunit SecG [Verrucomicrobiae bacterium]|jgi:protein translocase SecG subunit
MIYIAGLLTVLLLLNSALLILLVLVQLPKKDAGAGLAFGGGAADALFGAGSGNSLTKVTKYATGVFFALALILGYVEMHAHRSNNSQFTKDVQQLQTAGPTMSPTAPPATPATSAPPTNSLLSMPLPAATNSPAK